MSLGTHLRSVDPAVSTAGSPRCEFRWCHAASGPGGSGRFITDVLVELGFTDAERAQKAIEEARGAGTTPERMLHEQRAITDEQLSDLDH